MCPTAPEDHRRDRTCSRRRRAWPAQVALAVALLLARTDAAAAPLRTVVLVGSAQDAEVAARVRGQTADLDGELTTVERELPPDRDGQLAVAREASAGADVVVWFSAAEDGDRLAHILHRDRLFTRRIVVAPGALSRSASIEAVALAVRTALLGFAAEHEAATATPPPPPPVVAPPPPRPALRPWAELGGTALLDGTRASGRLGVAVRAGAGRGRWRLGLAAGYQPPAAADAAPTAIRLDRADAGLLLGADLLGRPTGGAPRWTLGVELGAGAARFRRQTTATETGLVATASATRWSPVVGAGVRAARRLGSRAFAAIEAGVDVLANAPVFGVARSTGYERLTSVWVVQPRTQLSLGLDWP